MELVYAALLLHSVKQPVNEANVAKVLTATGAHTDQAKIKALVSSLEGVNIDEAIAKAAVAPAAAAPAAAAPAAERKEEKKPEEEAKKAEEAAAGLGALFG
jgi:large subunit ribosomal protein L12